MASKAGNSKGKSSFNNGKVTAAQKRRASIAQSKDREKGNFIPF